MLGKLRHMHEPHPVLMGTSLPTASRPTISVSAQHSCSAKRRQLAPRQSDVSCECAESVSGRKLFSSLIFYLALLDGCSFSSSARVIRLAGASRKESDSKILVFAFAMVDCCSKILSDELEEAIERLKRNDPTLTELE
jgi:hypothetical protein